MIIRGSAAGLPLADETVQVCITSIPYFGLRSYHGLPAQIWGGAEDCRHEWGTAQKSGQRQRNGAAGGIHEGRDTNKLAANVMLNPDTGTYCQHCNAWRGHYGLEPQLSDYIAHTVEIFREVRRVLKPSGTLWLNVGDAYCNYRPGKGQRLNQQTVAGHSRGEPEICGRRGNKQEGLKEKDLIGLPWRVAFALQTDGWWLRSAITLCKRAPMPESVRDRPTQATEMLFLLSKQADYYYDSEAVKEPLKCEPHAPGNKNKRFDPPNVSSGHHWSADRMDKTWGNPNGRNLRNWIELTTEPNTWATCGDCHHTTDRWPKCAWCGGAQKQAESRGAYLNEIGLGEHSFHKNRTVTALPPGYDECPRCHGKQICPGCGSFNIIGHFAAFPSRIPELAIKAGTSEKGECAKCGAQVERVIETVNGRGKSWHDHKNDLVRGQRGQVCQDGYARNTIGWRATCQCNAGTRPNLVLDNFGGSGSTSVVAERLGRRHCMIELSADYIYIARARTRERSLFTAAGVSA